MDAKMAAHLSDQSTSPSASPSTIGPSAEKDKRLIISIDFGTTFTSVSFLDCDVGERISDVDLRHRIQTVNSYPGDHLTDHGSGGATNDIVPTKIWFPRVSDNGKRLEMELDMRNGANDVRMEDVDSVLYDSDIENGDLEPGPTATALPTEKDKALWGYEIQHKLDHEERLTTDGIESLLEGTIDQVKLMLDTSAQTEGIREEISKKIADIKHKKFRSPQEIIKQYMICLLGHVKTFLKDRYKLDIADFAVLDMVLCVPPSWSAKARRIMTRATAEAMKKSGLITKGEGSLTEMTIYKEPEAAGCWIMKAFNRATPIKPGDTVLFADLGGGTVDFSTYTVGRTDCLRLDREVVPPSGGTYGSVFLNKAFREHVERRLEHAFPYLQQSTGRTRKQIIEELVSKFERDVKRTLDLKGTSTCRRCLEVPGLRANADDDKRCGDGKFDIIRDQFRDIFEPSIKGILGLMDEQIRKCRERGKDVDKVILLGGFSDSPTVRYRVERKLKKLSRELGLITPIECIQQLPQVSRLTAVSYGGVIRALDKTHGPTRELESSYGVLLSIPWDQETHGGHPEVRWKYDKEKDGTGYVENTVEYFAKIGDIIPAQHAYTVTAYHTFPTRPTTLKFECEEVLCVSDTSTESYWPLTHWKNAGAEMVDTMPLDLTFLKDQGKIQQRVSPHGKRYYKVDFKLVVEVVGLSLYWRAIWEGSNGEVIDLSKRRQVSIAPGFFPGTA
jgi:molecular chaperone DnaK (HSP70)